MTKRVAATPAPGPLEEYAQRFDMLFGKRSQREGFRRYLEGLLLPAERNKTLTGLVNTEPVVGAQHAAAQRLQWFLSESNWEVERVNQQRLALLMEEAATAPSGQGVLVVDETGDRKWGSQTAHVGRQYLGSLGKVDNGVVSVQTLWADEKVYYPLAVEPYTPAGWFERGQRDPEFRTKPEIAVELVEEAVENGLRFGAVVADAFYGASQDFITGLERLEVGYVLAVKPSHAWWHKAGDIGSVQEMAEANPWQREAPGNWRRIVRRFRDGHSEEWWALESRGGPYGPDRNQRLVIVSTDPAKLPELTTWYLLTNLPAPGSQRAIANGQLVADLATVVRFYGLRVWVEQSYKQVKQSLGWAEYQVRSDMAIRRHWQLVCCAFSFCWWALRQADGAALDWDHAQQPAAMAAATEALAIGKKKERPQGRASSKTLLASGFAPGPGLARALDHASALLEWVVVQAPTASVTGTA